MDSGKAWYASKSVWGGIIALMAAIAGAFGFSIGAEDQAAMVDTIIAVIGGIGGLLAIVGRIRADRRIR